FSETQCIHIRCWRLRRQCRRRRRQDLIIAQKLFLVVKRKQIKHLITLMEI
ncbi:unnamed protein product, partial [Brassica napus]